MIERQNELTRKLDLELWNLVGGGQYHTQQMVKLKYRYLMKERNKALVEFLNRKSKLNDDNSLDD